MSPAMPEAFVRIKTNLHFEGKCCRDFSPTPNMLELFNSSMYDTQTQNNEEYGDDIIMQDEQIIKVYYQLCFRTHFFKLVLQFACLDKYTSSVQDKAQVCQY